MEDVELIKCGNCGKDVTITSIGQYCDMLSCGHAKMKSASYASIAARKDINPVQAQTISENLTKFENLPKILEEDLIRKVLASVNQDYETFFNAENPFIEDIIKEQRTDRAILVLVAIHQHLSRILYTANKYRSLYHTRIEGLRKSIEDKAVKEMIDSHDFNYANLAPKPKKIKSTGTKTTTEIEKGKAGLSGLTKADGTPLDVSKVFGALMWNKKDEKKEDEKKEYKEGLDKIKENIMSKD